MATIDVNKNGLTGEQADIVRQTLPVVGANIGEITPNFYRRMFAAHPELLADTFNRGNQKQGASTRRPRLPRSCSRASVTSTWPPASSKSSTRSCTGTFSMRSRRF